MGIFKGKEIFTIKPWLTDYKQNVEQLKKILGLSSDNMLPAIEEGDEGKVVGVSSGKYTLVEGGGGSSDFSTAEVTITVNAGTGGGGLDGGIAGFNEGYAFVNDYNLVTTAGGPGGLTRTFNALLMKNEYGFFEAYFNIIGTNPVTSGSCELLEDGETLNITGDCAITLDPVE